MIILSYDYSIILYNIYIYRNVNGISSSMSTFTHHHICEPMRVYVDMKPRIQGKHTHTHTFCMKCRKQNYLIDITILGVLVFKHFYVNLEFLTIHFIVMGSKNVHSFLTVSSFSLRLSRLASSHSLSLSPSLEYILEND